MSQATESPTATLRTVAVLCVQAKSIYHQIPGCDCYDLKRGAMSFPGGMPVIAHPPCRGWSAFCAHQSHATPQEKDLGLWCAARVRQHGGILEQPAHSRLWTAANLPAPGQPATKDGFSLEVQQCWWGFPQLKRTWLFFAGIERKDLPPIPFQFQPTNSRRAEQVMSKQQRSRTLPAFAHWLVEAARQVRA